MLPERSVLRRVLRFRALTLVAIPLVSGGFEMLVGKILLLLLSLLLMLLISLNACWNVFRNRTGQGSCVCVLEMTVIREVGHISGLINIHVKNNALPRIMQ